VEFYIVILIGVLIFWNFIYTASYSIWMWKNKNRLGTVMVFFLALTALILPVYVFFIMK